MKTLFPALLLLAAALQWSASVQAENPAPSANPVKSQLPLEELRTFTQVFDQIRQAYVEEIDDKTLLKNAIIGMLAELDPHSTYLDQDAFDSLQEHSTGEFGGLGIEVAMENGLVKVISPIDDTPAAKAGIKAGDLIIKLDDQAVQGMNLQEAVGLMKGEAGDSIQLTIIRAGEEKPLKIELVRAIIKVRSVRNDMLEPDYGYVRISQFQEHTGEQFIESLTSLKKDSPLLKGIVLDLRNNPGGLLGASIEVADAILEEGLIVFTKGRLGAANIRHTAKPGDILSGLPIVVIINSGSASAAEIVAGALQDHRRALVVGTTSFGKGSVQTVLPISEGRAIKLTTARYFTPNGRSIQAEGIAPDIRIPDAELRYLDSSLSLKEKNLAGHLDNDQEHATKTDQTSRLADDHQLLEALNLLKAANWLRQPKVRTESQL